MLRATTKTQHSQINKLKNPFPALAGGFFTMKPPGQAPLGSLEDSKDTGPSYNDLFWSLMHRLQKACAFFHRNENESREKAGQGKTRHRGDWGSGLQKQIIRAEEASILRLEVQTQARVGGWLQFLTVNIRVILANRVLTLLVVSCPSGGPSGWQCRAF